MHTDPIPYDTHKFKEACALIDRVKTITDQRELMKIVLLAHFDNLTYVALDRITDPAILKELADSISSSKLRIAIFEKLGRKGDILASQLILEQGDPYSPVANEREMAKKKREQRVEALMEKFRLLEEEQEETLFLRIVMSAYCDFIVREALARIKDPALLEKVAQNHTDIKIRADAMAALGQPQRIYALYAQSWSATPAQQLDAIEKLTDRALLHSIWQDGTRRQKYRRTAKYRLHSLETGEPYRLEVTGTPFVFTTISSIPADEDSYPLRKAYCKATPHIKRGEEAEGFPPMVEGGMENEDFLSDFHLDEAYAPDRYDAFMQDRERLYQNYLLNLHNLQRREQYGTYDYPCDKLLLLGEHFAVIQVDVETLIVDRMGRLAYPSSLDDSTGLDPQERIHLLKLNGKWAIWDEDNEQAVTVAL